MTKSQFASVKKRGFKSLTAYQEHLAKQRGFSSRTEYQKSLRQNRKISNGDQELIDMIAMVKSEAGISYTELAKCLNISRNTIERYVHGMTCPTIRSKSKLMKILGEIHLDFIENSP